MKQHPDEDRWPWPTDITFQIRQHPGSKDHIYVGYEAVWYGELRTKWVKLYAPWRSRLDNELLVGVLINLTEDARTMHKSLTLNNEDGNSGTASAEPDAAV